VAGDSAKTLQGTNGDEEPTRSSRMFCVQTTTTTKNTLLCRLETGFYCRLHQPAICAIQKISLFCIKCHGPFLVSTAYVSWYQKLIFNRKKPEPRSRPVRPKSEPTVMTPPTDPGWHGSTAAASCENRRQVSLHPPCVVAQVGPHAASMSCVVGGRHGGTYGTVAL
jgi:hypothetical protein